ncbi:transmembrane GTPase fzo1 [Bisporella sp. PMI_857]|nr:transmembrane GTPase fzo1 [Bisporella sp. PMI_857]
MSQEQQQQEGRVKASLRFGRSTPGQRFWYGGSLDGASNWNPTMTADTPTPAHTPTIRGNTVKQRKRRDRVCQATAIHQLWYNQHRGTLGRSINTVSDLTLVTSSRDVEVVAKMNAIWPATYPSVQNAESSSRQEPRPGLIHTQSTLSGASNITPPRPGTLNRSQTSIGESASAESSKAAEQRIAPEPRLVSPQIAQQFSVLKLDLKLGNLHQTELVHSLEKNAIASLLDGQISSSIKHLLSLRERIEDTSSKVLVTGDVNVGKSTFCNALLRRKNSGIEEVHAIRKNMIYNRHDESSYDVYTLHDLEKLVTDDATYSNCKIYLRDVRSIDKSLLNNGVVDIAIIDAPSLNNDTTRTTAVFARQEEIDVVVFVVSAANQITLSAKEFIWAAANEKAYIFMVVNGYEIIKNKERFQETILKQIHGLSPSTFKNSSELVHFVSSNAIPTAPLGPGGPGGSGSGSGSSGSSGDEPDDDDSDPKGKGKEKEKIQDFERLEESLRRFVLEKRARSKLAPAKTYLLNVLGDVHTLATVNQEVAQSELNRVTKDLSDIEPKLEASQKAKAEVSDDIDKTIEGTCKDIYSYTRSTITSSIEQAAADNHGIPYPGAFFAFDYAHNLTNAMLSQISDSVEHCEKHARKRTVEGVSSIKELGFLHLGDEYTDLQFRSDVMFKRRRDNAAKNIKIETEIWDFFDWPTLMQRQEKVAGTGMAMTVATVVGGRVMGGFGWVDGAIGAARVVGNNTLRKIIAAQLVELDYVHSNSDRISSEVRKVLLFPANHLRVGLQRSVESLGARRDETLKIRGESEVARKYFSNLVTKTTSLRNTVEAVDLEGPAPGVAAAYDP